MYPAIVTAMMLGVVVLAVTFVLPGYSRIFAASGTELPMLTRGLLTVSGFMAVYGMWVLPGLLAVFILFIAFVRSTGGRGVVSRLLLFIPLYRHSINFLLAQSLYLLLNAGLPVSLALPHAQEVMENVRVRQDLFQISAQMEMGKPFWQSVAEIGYIDTMFTGMARVGEESGRMPQIMDKCRVYYSQTYRTAIRRVNKLVEPIITLAVGAGLAIIMLAVILPTFELATVI